MVFLDDDKGEFCPKSKFYNQKQTDIFIFYCMDMSVFLQKNMYMTLILGVKTNFVEIQCCFTEKTLKKLFLF